jgi:hypothetical protein
VLVAAKMLARRVQFLETQAEALDAQIDAMVTEANPGFAGGLQGRQRRRCSVVDHRRDQSTPTAQ